MSEKIDLLERIDCHTHPWEEENQIEEFLREYAKKSYKQICFTNHYAYSIPGEFPFSDSERFVKEREEVKRVKERLGLDIKVYISSEINWLDEKGKLESDYNPDALEDLDYISAGPHHYTEEDIKNYGDNLFKHARKSLLSLVKRSDVKVILHPFVHIRDSIDMGELSADYINEFARLAKGHDKVIEIHRDMNEKWLPFIEGLMKCKVRLVVGSDAHSVPEIDDVKRAVELIRKVNPNYSLIGMNSK